MFAAEQNISSCLWDPALEQILGLTGLAALEGKSQSDYSESALLSMKLKYIFHLEFTNCFSEATENYWMNQQSDDFYCSLNEISFQLSHRLEVCVPLKFSEAEVLPLNSCAGLVPPERAGQVTGVCG